MSDYKTGTEVYHEVVGVIPYGDESGEIAVGVYPDVTDHPEGGFNWYVHDPCQSPAYVIKGWCNQLEFAKQIATQLAVAWVNRERPQVDPTVAEFADDLWDVFNDLGDGLQSLAEWCKAKNQTIPAWVADAQALVDSFEKEWNEIVEDDDLDEDDLPEYDEYADDSEYDLVDDQD